MKFVYTTIILLLCLVPITAFGHDRVISVISTGAIPNDGLDDWTGIQAALTAAAGGGEVYLPPGVYNLSQTLKIGSQTTMTGAGIKATRLILTAASNVDVIQNTDPVNGNSGIELARFEIEGNGSAQTALGMGVYLVNVTDFHIHDLYVHHCRRDGIEISGAASARGFIKNNITSDNGTDESAQGTGIALISGRQIVISGNVTRNNHHFGIDLEINHDQDNIDQVVIANNVVDAHPAMGIGIIGRPNKALTDITVSDNLITNVTGPAGMGGFGIKVEECRWCTISGNRIRTTSNAGIYFGGLNSSDGTLSGNHIYHASAFNDAAADGIYLASAQTRVLIQGNHIFGVGTARPRYGINAPTATELLIDGNIAGGWRTGAINAPGTNVVLGTNKTNP